MNWQSLILIYEKWQKLSCVNCVDYKALSTECTESSSKTKKLKKYLWIFLGRQKAILIQEDHDKSTKCHLNVQLQTKALFQWLPNKIMPFHKQLGLNMRNIKVTSK